MGHKWKKLYQLYKEQQEILKKNFAEEVSKLEADQANLVIEQRKHMLMQGDWLVVFSHVCVGGWIMEGFFSFLLNGFVFL